MNTSIAIEVMRLNNAGIASLERNEYENAKRVFARGLTLVKQELADHQEHLALQDEEDQDEYNEDGLQFERYFYFALSSSSSSSRSPQQQQQQQHHTASGAAATAAAPSSKSNVQDSNVQQSQQHQQQQQQERLQQLEDQTTGSSEPFIFRSPIVVASASVAVDTFASSASAAPASLSFEYFIMLSYVMLYNLALSHHLCAMQQPSSSQPNIRKNARKALALYELAYSIQRTEEIQLSVLQSMALVNNLATLYKVLGSQDKSTQCFQQLVQTIMYVNDCGVHSEIEHMDGFLGNVLPLILGEDMDDDNDSANGDAKRFAPAA